VWTGYDEPMPMGTGEAGATVALPAFIDFMREAHKKLPVADFPVPAGVTRVLIDPATGLRAYPDEADAMDEVFLSGTEPTQVSVPDAGAGDVDAGATLTTGTPVGAPGANDGGPAPSSGGEAATEPPPPF